MRFLNAILENEKVAKTIIKHREIAYFQFRKFHCKNPYNSLCFGRIFLDFCSKSAPKTLEIHVFFDKEKLIAKTLIIPYVLEGF